MKFPHIFILIDLTITFINADIELPISDILEIQLGKCLINISNEYFKDIMPVIIERNIDQYCSKDGRNLEENYTNLITVLSEGMNHSVIHLNCYMEYKERHDIKPGSAVLIMPNDVTTPESMVRFTSFFVHTLFSLYGNRAMRIVVVSKHLSKSRKSQMSLASAMLFGIWRTVQIADAIVLLPAVAQEIHSRKIYPSIDVLTWFTNDQSDVCLLKVDRVKYLDHWQYEEERFVTNTNLFPVKDVTNMRGCELKVELKKDPPFGHFMNKNERFFNDHNFGVYGVMLEAIGDFCNISFSYFIEVDEDLSLDIIAPIFLVPGDDIHDSCYFSYPYFKDTVTLYVPITPIPKWQGIIRVFDIEMSILIAATYVFGSFVFWLFAKLKNQGLDDISLALMNTLRTYLGDGMHTARKYRGVISTSFLTLWLFFCIQISTAFQSVLIVFLINPGTYPPISSIEELDKSGFKKMSSYDFVGTTDVEKEWRSYGKCYKHDCWNILGQNSRVAVLGNRFHFDVLVSKIIGRSKVSRVTDSVKDYLPVSYIQLGCIFGRRFNSLFHRLVMAGISNFWLLKSSYLFWRTLKNESDVEEVTSISLVHLQGLFYLVLIGFLLAFIVFVCELLFR
ncbi:Ionotropic receptor 549 [Blattella germanica]|nr:Ionotropic receptor 549 [Blattella germanica]